MAELLVTVLVSENPRGQIVSTAGVLSSGGDLTTTKSSSICSLVLGEHISQGRGTSDLEERPGRQTVTTALIPSCGHLHLMGTGRRFAS